MSKPELSDEAITRLAKEILNQNKLIVKSESAKKLRNIKLLLTNYRFVRNHLNIELPIIEDDTQLSNYELSLYSLIAYRARTKEMLIFFNAVLDEYKAICYKTSPDMIRRYEVIAGLYLNEEPEDKTDLAIRLQVDVRTISRDEKKATNELAVTTFGFDGLNDMTK